MNACLFFKGKRGLVKEIFFLFLYIYFFRLKKKNKKVEREKKKRYIINVGFFLWIFSIVGAIFFFWGEEGIVFFWLYEFFFIRIKQNQ